MSNLSASDRYLLLQQRRHEWDRMTPVERVQTWVAEIKINLPGIKLAVGGCQLSRTVVVEVSWQWEGFHRLERRVPVEPVPVEFVSGGIWITPMEFPYDLLRDRDENFALFSERVRRAIRQTVCSTAERQTVIQHETAEQYVESHAPRRR